MTISNSIRSFGIGPAQPWGTLVWGSDKWGEGNDPVSTTKWTTIGVNNSISGQVSLIRNVTKLPTMSAISSDSEVIRAFYRILANGVTVSDALIRSFTRVLDDSVAGTDALVREFTRVHANTISCDADNESEKIYDNAGYVNDWPGGMQDGEDRVFDTWTEDSDAATTFSEDSTPTTTWSDA